MPEAEAGSFRNLWFFRPNGVMFGVPFRGHPEQEGR